MKATASYLLMLQNYINSKQIKIEIKDYALCLGNILKHSIINNMKKEDWSELYFFSVDFNPINANDIDILKHLMKGT